MTITHSISFQADNSVVPYGTKTFAYFKLKMHWFISVWKLIWTLFNITELSLYISMTDLNISMIDLYISMTDLNISMTDLNISMTDLNISMSWACISRWPTNSSNNIYNFSMTD